MAEQAWRWPKYVCIKPNGSMQIWNTEPAPYELETDDEWVVVVPQDWMPEAAMFAPSSSDDQTDTP
jgi:hypothetical protein